MNRGFVNLWRCSLDSQVWKSDGLWKVWCWCLMKASYSSRWKSIITGRGETEIELLPGQFIFGRKSAAKELGMTESTIRNRIEKLKKIGNLVVKPDTHYSIVTVCNWKIYNSVEIDKGQAKGQAKDNQRTTKGHKQTLVTLKERESDAKIAFGSFSNVLLSEQEHSKLLGIFNDKTEERIERLSEYIASKGKRYKSHYATILSWARKDGLIISEKEW